MPADPARIPAMTVDGVVLAKVDPDIKATHIGATEGEEREMFFDDPAHAQILLDECWAWRSDARRLRESIEVETTLGLGTSIPIAPAVPLFAVTDESRKVDALGALRAYAANHDTDRHAVDLIGTTDETEPVPPLSISGTPETHLTVGVPYSFTASATGGVPPRSFAYAGVLPAGLSFDPETGQLSGTPTGEAPAALSISGTPATDLIVGTAYEFTPLAAGGATPYGFSVTGALPPGLVFDPETGRLHGTPTS